MTYGSDQDKVSTVPLIPEIVSIRLRSQGQENEIITNGKILVEELWTTAALTDRLKSLIIQVKEQSQSPFRYDRRYLNKAVELIEN
jgi:hypothetical protein